MTTKELKSKKEYCYSFDGEYFYRSGNSEKTAIEDARYDNPESNEVYVGICEDVELEWSDLAEDVINSMLYHLEYYTECPDSIFDISEDEQSKLNQIINIAIKKWITENNIKSNCFMVKEKRKINLK